MDEGSLRVVNGVTYCPSGDTHGAIPDSSASVKGFSLDAGSFFRHRMPALTAVPIVRRIRLRYDLLHTGRRAGFLSSFGFQTTPRCTSHVGHDAP